MKIYPFHYVILSIFIFWGESTLAQWKAVPKFSRLIKPTHQHQQRSYFSSSKFKGLGKVLKKVPRLNPMYSLYWVHQDFNHPYPQYPFAPDSKTKSLIENNFRLLNGTYLPTVLPDLPAYSLNRSPELTAEIISLLEQGKDKFEDYPGFQQLTDKWTNFHSQLTEGKNKLSAKQISRYVQKVIDSHRESKEKKNPHPYFTYHLLQSSLLYSIEKKEELAVYLKTLKNSNKKLQQDIHDEDIDTYLAMDEFSQKNVFNFVSSIDNFHHYSWGLLNEIDKLFNQVRHYDHERDLIKETDSATKQLQKEELLIHTMINKDSILMGLPPFIFGSTYAPSRFPEAKKAGDCMENTLRNFIHVLIYDPVVKKLNPQLFPQSLQKSMRADFLNFIQQNNCPTTFHSPASGQKWMDLVSFIPGVRYGQDLQYELFPSSKNFILVLNHLLGLDIKENDFFRLSQALSSEARKVIIRPDLSDDNLYFSLSNGPHAFNFRIEIKKFLHAQLIHYHLGHKDEKLKLDLNDRLITELNDVMKNNLQDNNTLKENVEDDEKTWSQFLAGIDQKILMTYLTKKSPLNYLKIDQLLAYLVMQKDPQMAYQLGLSFMEEFHKDPSILSPDKLLHLSQWMKRDLKPEFFKNKQMTKQFLLFIKQKESISHPVVLDLTEKGEECFHDYNKNKLSYFEELKQSLYHWWQK